MLRTPPVIFRALELREHLRRVEPQVVLRRREEPFVGREVRAQVRRHVALAVRAPALAGPAARHGGVEGDARLLREERHGLGDDGVAGPRVRRARRHAARAGASFHLESCPFAVSAAPCTVP
jgi:hypothetical protein